jgi:hypothetical protein
MKKFLLVTLSSISFLMGYSQAAKQIFESPSLSNLLATAKTVAILPFKVAISYKKLPKNMSLEQIKDNEKAESIQMQQGMYTYLLRKSSVYTVAFQDLDRTNAILKKAGVFDSLDEILPDSLCKLLAVDAVIKSNWSYAKTGSEGGAIASALLLGVAKSTGSGQLVMQINEAKKGEMVWRMAKEMDEGAFSSANELMERMMRKVGRLFPFEQAK